MPEFGEKGGAGVVKELDVKDVERKCPKCGAAWKKTEPTLAQVRRAIQEELCKFEKDLHQLEATAELGYRGSVARGTVGNPKKSHYGMPPDIRGECGNKFDVDGFLLTKKLFFKIKPDKFGKRWAADSKSLRKMESQMRKALKARPELEHMKPGSDGFELLVRHHKERGKLFEKGGVIILIFGS